MSEPLLLRAAEAAKLLQVGKNTIYAMAASGEIPSLHIGRQLRIPEQELREWIHAQVASANRAQ
jgi:excisionase family DNA binding protein